MNKPSEYFANYKEHSFGGGEPRLEEITATLFDSEMFIPGVTTQLRFFQKLKPTKSESNMYFPGQLPNPMAFDIHCIRINGINARLMHGACELRIANKLYGVNPAWNYSMKEKGMKLSPPLFLAPLQYFIFTMEWIPTPLPWRGFEGQRLMVHPIQVCLHGQMLRAIC